MCGICGFVAKEGKNNVEENIRSMVLSLNHRGPDVQKHHIVEIANRKVALGHARLSIIDLSPLGNQPMHFEGNSLIFNGEFYNYKSVRKELITLGYTFKSDSDSEVLLKGYHAWGTKVLDHMIGMFAFTIFDSTKRQLFFARDRVGVKPFFYSHHQGTFLFGSELRSLKKYDEFDAETDPSSLYQFFHYGYFPEPNTIYKNTLKLNPGHYGIYDIGHDNLKTVQYWDPSPLYNGPASVKSEAQILDELDELFRDAFNLRMVSDVPVGIFLSGGYDSSLVTAILEKTNKEQIKTFTIGFEEKEFNEADDARKVAKYLGTDHYEYYCTQKEGMDIIPELGRLYDEPFGDASSIPTVLLSRFCKEHVTVALSADGGDEIFAGYNSYTRFKSVIDKAQKLRRGLSPGLTRQMVKLLLKSRLTDLSGPKKSGLLDSLLGYLQDNDLKKFSQRFKFQNSSDFIGNFFTESPQLGDSSFASLYNLYDDSDPIRNSQFMDLHTFLPGDILTKIDRASMSVSLESREPLLDHRIIEYAASIPQELVFKNGVKKSLLKQITHKYIPEEIMNRPKKGFGVPVADWMRTSLKDITLDHLSEASLAKIDFLNHKNVIKLRDDYLKGNTTNFELVWYLLMFTLWNNHTE